MGNCCSDRKKRDEEAKRQAEAAASPTEATGLLTNEQAASSEQGTFPAPRQEEAGARGETAAGDTGSAGGPMDASRGEGDDAKVKPADTGASGVPAVAAGQASQEAAATKIQSTHRGNAARKNVGKGAAAAPGAATAAAGQGQEAAATKIQAVHRGNAARKKVGKLHGFTAAPGAAGQGQGPEGQSAQNEEMVATKDDEALNLQSQLHSAVGGEAPVIITVVGDETLDSASQELVKHLSQKMGEALKGKACYVTCSQKGVQELFAKSSPDPEGICNLCTVGGSSGFGVGKDEPRARDPEHLSAVFSQLADIVLAVDGAAGGAAYQGAWWQDVCMSYAWGAVVVPVVLGAGAADLEAQGFPRPPCVPEASWATLSSPTAEHAARAEAATVAVQSLYAARHASIEEMSKNAKGHWKLAHNQIRQRAVIGHLGGSKLQDAISHEEVAHMEEQDFEGALSRLGAKKKQRGGVGKASAADTRPEPAAKGEGPSAPQTGSGMLPTVKSKKLADATRLDKLPPPAKECHVTKANEHMDEIEEARKRMEARMDEIHKKTEGAAVKIQATARGNAARKSVAVKKGETASQASK